MASKTLNFEFLVDFLYALKRLPVEADVACHKSNMKQLHLSKLVKRMFYLGYVLLCYSLIYNRRSNFRFSQHLYNYM